MVVERYFSRSQITKTDSVSNTVGKQICINIFNNIIIYSNNVSQKCVTYVLNNIIYYNVLKTSHDFQTFLIVSALLRRV